MRKLSLKCTAQSAGHLTRQHPSVPAGVSEDGNTTTYIITDIPDNVDDNTVGAMAEETGFWNTFTAAYRNIGYGKVVPQA